MSYQAAKESYAAEIADIKAAGLWKTERVITSDQKNDIPSRAVRTWSTCAQTTTSVSRITPR